MVAKHFIIQMEVTFGIYEEIFNQALQRKLQSINDQHVFVSQVAVDKAEASFDYYWNSIDFEDLRSTGLPYLQKCVGPAGIRSALVWQQNA